jgi:hypothetical protein
MATQSPEQNKIIQIARDYFRRETGSDEKADKMLMQLSEAVKDDGGKLVQLGNVLFLILVRGKGVVEIHTIGYEAQPRQMAENFRQLAAYLKNIGVKTAYTYTEDKKFSRLAKMTGLPAKEFPVKVQGKAMTAYVMEF